MNLWQTIYNGLFFVNSFAIEICIVYFSSSFAKDQNFQSLKDLGPDQMLEGMVRCLWKCSPKSREAISNYKLPGNAVDRFRIASKLAGEIKALGIREEIGYQAILYPNVFDSRRIFLSLFDKIPKETVEMEQKVLSKFR